MIDNKIKKAITNYIDVQRDYNYLGMLSNKRIERNGEVIATIKKRFASRKTNGCYKELKPIINYI